MPASEERSATDAPRVNGKTEANGYANLRALADGLQLGVVRLEQRLEVLLDFIGAAILRVERVLDQDFVQRPTDHDLQRVHAMRMEWRISQCAYVLVLQACLPQFVQIFGN